jgi:hypothetical protein
MFPLCLALALANGGLAWEVARPSPHETTRIRFVRPDDWRCSSTERCVDCTNTARAASVIIVSEERTDRTLDVPTRSTVRICRP